MTLMKKYALHILLVLNGGLALCLAWLWVTPDGSLRNVRWQAPEPQTTDFAAMMPPLPGVSSADTSQFIAMLDRPLFSATRRPPPPPPPPQPEEAPPVDNLSSARLSGVFVGEGTGGIILQIAGKFRRARLNEAVDGWTLKSIQGRDVTFTKGGQRRVLQLPRAALTTYTGMAPAAPSPAASPAVSGRAARGSVSAAPPGAAAPAPEGTRGAPLRPSFGGRR